MNLLFTNHFTLNISIYRNLVLPFRGVFRTLSNIYDGAFFVDIVNGKTHLVFSQKKAPSKIFARILITPLPFLI